MATNTDQPTILGSQVNAAYAGTVGVIGQIDQSISGNTILRVGNLTIGESGWFQAAHVVLTPDERERLIAALIAHRDSAPVVTR